MEIKYFGHSAFSLFDGTTRLWIDPFFTGNPFAGDWKKEEAPDLLLITHDHGDHIGDAFDIVAHTSAEFLAIADICYYAGAQGVQADRIMYGGSGMGIGGTIKYKGYTITMTSALHSSPHGLATGFVIQDKKGFTVYHAGDTALFSDMCLIAERYKIDVALLPIGGHFTMDAHDAAKACAYLETKAVIPMHYATFPILAQDTKEFQKLLPEFSEGTKFIELTHGNFVQL